MIKSKNKYTKTNKLEEKKLKPKQPNSKIKIKIENKTPKIRTLYTIHSTQSQGTWIYFFSNFSFAEFYIILQTNY